jgi:hypothetical protein
MDEENIKKNPEIEKNAIKCYNFLLLPISDDTKIHQTGQNRC